MKFFTYFSLGSTIYGSVQSIISAYRMPTRPDAGTLYILVAPSVNAVQAAFPAVRIKHELVQHICAAVVEAIEDYAG